MLTLQTLIVASENNKPPLSITYEPPDGAVLSIWGSFRGWRLGSMLI